ncbi:MAG: hypothetical protein FJ128_00390 [Deltaproteobacteria bacterium]|nr:hypothetical protein [Deltaproteobacteria bacterium]
MIENLVRQVQANCQVANASQAGNFSLCGLLLRLRQLYKWEHGLLPWQEPEPAPVLAWVESQENLWESLEGEAPAALSVNGSLADPFAVDTLNAWLKAHGLAYGAGLSRGLAPTFFLGELAQVRRLGEATVFILDRELARDLDGSPALCQDTLIYVRRQTLAFYLWDRLSDPTQQGNRLVNAALESRGLSLLDLLRQPHRHQARFQDLLADEVESALHHELGELGEKGMRQAFYALLERFPQSRAEVWGRGLKDALAEVSDSGRLAYLIRERRFASLALFLAWQPGLYPLLLPELEPACRELRDGGWEALEEARGRALERLRGIAAELQDLLEARRSDSETQAELDRRFLQPLGL